MLKLVRTSSDLTVEGKKARQYDQFSRQYRMQDLKGFAELATNHGGDGGSVLDIATDPGYCCIELANMGRFSITGLDISQDLVNIARADARQADVAVDFVKGSASAMPFPNGTFNLTFCSWAMKTFMDLAKVLERTFAWLGRPRRLSKDYERLCETSEALMYAAMSRLMVRRLARV